MKEKDYRKIAENIRKYRKLRNLTQEQMAYELDIDTQYYSQLEQGRRRFTLEKVVDCCNILSIRVEDIIPAAKDKSEDTKKLIKDINTKLDSASSKQLLMIEKFIDNVIPFV